ncbi:MAG: hypothetical protein U0Q12_01415 [Vicinamibacterales bacterium]
MSRTFLRVVFCAAAAAATSSVATLAASDKKAKDPKKPSLVLKATPAVSFAPAKIVLRAEIRGGPDDYQDFYCATVEWDWGDGTKSENSYDCEPYEAGKSEIRRRFLVEHVYQTSGEYRVQFNLKQRDHVIAATNTQVQVRPGLREGIPGQP